MRTVRGEGESWGACRTAVDRRWRRGASCGIHRHVKSQPESGENVKRVRPSKAAAAARRPEDRLAIKALHLADKILARVWHHTVVLKRHPLPAEGPAILVCNHTSGLDPLLIQSVVERVVIWMMAKEYYDIKALTWVFKTIEAIPVDRSARDTGSVRAALRHLADGRILGVFPEGRIERTRELMPFQTGVAMMAIKTGVPVYPAFLDGTQRNKTMLGGFIWPNRATLSFGPPVEFNRSSTSRENLEDATDRIKAAVAALRGAP
jgi:1-acyl-sn-glycerol-3-phosphate acyltransferase